MEGKKVNPRCYTTDTKIVIGKLGSVWKKRGYKIGEFHSLIRAAGYFPSRKTLFNWIGASKSPKSRSSFLGARGPKKKLGKEEEDVLSGYILTENQLGQIVDSAKIIRFCQDKMGISISQPTVSRLLCKLGFSSRVSRVSDKKKIESSYQLAKKCAIFIRQLRKSGVLNRKLGLIGSIDVTYTSNRTYRPRTYALKRG